MRAIVDCVNSIPMFIGRPKENSKTTINKEKYDKITNGMKYDQVMDIVGGKGVEKTRNLIDGTEIRFVTWKGERQSEGYADVIFYKDKVGCKREKRL